MKDFYVYIMASKSKTLYIGMTNDLQRRVYEHKHKLIEGFTSKYNIDQLVYFEMLPGAQSAITREKQLKTWLRIRKIELIESGNPYWSDLSTGWFDH